MNEVFSRHLGAGGASRSLSQALAPDHAADLAALAASDLFDAPWYLAEYPDVAARGSDPAVHFIVAGWREDRAPNRYFDPRWYRAANPDVALAHENPLLHYIRTGEAEGRPPSELFDLAWYATQHAPDPGRTLLAHFLARRRSGLASPLPEFDPAWYLARNPDVAAAGLDPFEHYLLYGAREGRDPAPWFDTTAYAAQHLAAAPAENPLLHARRHRPAAAPPPPAELPEAICDIALLAASDLFDVAWYAEQYPDSGADPLASFCTTGWRAGHAPNRYFDPAWYLAGNPEVAAAGLNPILHYIATGEAEGRSPCEYFDLPWYATRTSVPPGRTLLAHFLAHRRDGTASPLPEFDAGFYLERYPDIAAAGVDPFEHYLLYGFREGRDPSPTFNTRFYLQRHLAAATDLNPILHYRRHRHAVHLPTLPPVTEADVFEDVRRFSRPGPDFETIQPLPPSARRRAEVLAFYLPQFHPIPENDAWWGTGFTEWTAIARGMPRFPGHYQPRTPRDLGHYTLGDTPEGRATLRRQTDLACAAGLAGFVHYFYWFNTTRLLASPLDALLADPSIDFPFCLMWANENWTRRWDGSDQEILIRQDYDAADDNALIDCLSRHFADPRYIRIDGRPLLMVYRAADIPDPPATLARWRALFAARHGENPIWVMSQSFDALDPRNFGFDAAVEFPPHKLVTNLPRRNAEIAFHDHRATAHIYAYADLVAASLDEPAPDFPLIRTAVPSWDNDARRQGHGLVVHGSTPAAYQSWLATLVDRAAAAPPLGLPLVCVNAWNEWAEGAYLEPDVHFGAAYLNATARAITQSSAPAPAKLLLVGHDAFPAGAQHLLLHLLRRLRKTHGVQAEYLLLGDGPLAPAYADAAPGTILTDPAALDSVLARGFTSAIVNTAAAAWIVPRLRAAGLRVTLLIHELPGLIAEKHLTEAARAGAEAAHDVVFPAPFVRDRFVDAIAPARGTTAILPQGLYAEPTYCPRARTRLRARLGLDATTPLILGAGYADLRKGFDLFLQAWRAARRRRSRAVFCWLGDLDPTMQAYLAPEITAATATGTFHLPGRQDDIAAWLSAADAFALTSREDPFPSVALEALATGLQVAAFADSGGIPALLTETSTGRILPMGDADAMARALLDLAKTDPSTRPDRARPHRARFDFSTYTAALLTRACALPTISVAVPSYNYARYLPDRLASIFAQTHPVTEILLLDDASTDDSPAIARAIAAEWNRDLRVITARRNSGSAFRQWLTAARTATSDFLWIAEADDVADPALLATLAARLAGQPDAILAIADSRAIDAEGNLLWPDHRAYFTDSGAPDLCRDGLFPAHIFAQRFLAERNLILNVSAVLWRRTALLAALERCAPDLPSYRLAGDWRVYLEATLNADGTVIVAATPLNAHRRHPASLTATTDSDTHASETARLQALVRDASQRKINPSPR